MRLNVLLTRMLCGCMKRDTEDAKRGSQSPPRELDISGSTPSSSPEKLLRAKTNECESFGDRLGLELNPEQLLDLFSTEEIKDPADLTPERVYRYSDGAEYKGQWKGLKREGEGEMKWSKETWYRGSWSAGRPSGFGTMQLRSGVTYEGHWKNWEFQPSNSNLLRLEWFEQWLQAVNDGYGKHYSVWLWFELRRESLPRASLVSSIPTDQLSSYISSLSESLKEYLAIMDYCEKLTSVPSKFTSSANGIQRYLGCYSNGQREGLGRFEFMPGCVYEGAWVKGERSGFGIQRWQNGKMLQGFWQSGKSHGPVLTIDPAHGNELAIWECGRKAQVL